MGEKPRVAAVGTPQSAAAEQQHQSDDLSIIEWCSCLQLSSTRALYLATYNELFHWRVPLS